MVYLDEYEFTTGSKVFEHKHYNKQNNTNRKYS
jgi:hypothetical protein